MVENNKITINSNADDNPLNKINRTKDKRSCKIAHLNFRSLVKHIEQFRINLHQIYLIFVALMKCCYIVNGGSVAIYYRSQIKTVTFWARGSKLAVLRSIYRDTRQG